MDLIMEAVTPRVTQFMNEIFLHLFTRLDIERTLKQMTPDKSPGHDGLSVLFFFQKYWDVVGDEVIKLCLRVLNDDAELLDFNHTLIALISKINCPHYVMDFCLISLCTIVYKLVSKTMVNRIKSMLPKIISPY